MGMIFMLCGLAAAIFTVGMILFRPEQYFQLLKAEEERKAAAEVRKKQRVKELGMAVKMAERVWKKK